MGQLDELSYRYRMMLSALILGKVCKRFDEGKPAYTAVELKLETNIPVRIVQQLLFDMQNANLVTYVAGDEKEAQARYQPAVALKHLTLGYMMSRLESAGKWNLDLDVRKHLNTEQWLKFYKLRRKYLNELDEISLSNL